MRSQNTSLTDRRIWRSETRLCLRIFIPSTFCTAVSYQLQVSTDMATDAGDAAMASRTLDQSARPTNRLFRLPAELRDYILTLTVTEPEPIDIRTLLRGRIWGRTKQHFQLSP